MTTQRVTELTLPCPTCRAEFAVAIGGSRKDGHYLDDVDLARCGAAHHNRIYGCYVCPSCGGHVTDLAIMDAAAAQAADADPF